MKLSILLTAYNQIELLRWNIASLLQNESDDYEIVIQDDCSEDNIIDLIRQFDDDRICYYCNPVNYGHDRNVIEGFKNCRSDHVFLLRSSDTILPGKIKIILDFIEKMPDVGYVRFSCIDESGKVRIQYHDTHYEDRMQIINLNRIVLLHPSGELYNRKLLPERDLNILSEYLDRYFHDRNKYVINELLRDKLSMSASFFLSKEFVWQYTRTEKRTDIAQNRNVDGICIYAPLYLHERLCCEISYIANEIQGNYCEKKLLMIRVFDHYARMSIHEYKGINKNKAMQRHYGYEEAAFNSFKELKLFKQVAIQLAGDLPANFGDIVRKKARKLSLLSIGYWIGQDISFKFHKGLQ